MRILILCDHLDSWSVHNRARAIAKFLPKHEFDIRAMAKGCLQDHASFDAVHFNFTSGLTLFHEFIVNNKQRCVITVVNERSLFDGFECDPILLETTLLVCPYVTTLSRRVIERIPHAVFIPNGIDEDLFPKPRKRVVGYAGTTKANKNSNLVVEACARLGLSTRFATYQGPNRLHTIPHDRMHAFYEACDVYVHPSATEAFNNTVLEAVACNVPVIMTRVGSWREFEGYVTLVEPTVDALVDALKPWAGRALVDQKFLWRDVIPQYGAMYEAVAARHAVA